MTKDLQDLGRRRWLDIWRHGEGGSDAHIIWWKDWGRAQVKHMVHNLELYIPCPNMHLRGNDKEFTNPILCWKHMEPRKMFTVPCKVSKIFLLCPDTSVPVGKKLESQHKNNDNHYCPSVGWCYIYNYICWSRIKRSRGSTAVRRLRAPMTPHHCTCRRLERSET